MKLAALPLIWLVSTGLSPAPRQDALDPLWAAARAVSPTPFRVDRDRETWLRDRADYPDTDAEAERMWRTRLTASAAQDRAARSLVAQSTDLDAGCVDIGLADCASPIGGYLKADGERLYWQIQEGVSAIEGRGGGYVLLGGGDGLITPLGWGTQAYVYQAPVVLTVDADRYVAVAGWMRGTGRYNADALYRWNRDGSLTAIDNEAWRDSLAERLPAGLEIWKGVTFHYDDEVTASTALWRPRDANCCPTGGEAWLSFRIEGDRLVLASVEITTPPRP